MASRTDARQQLRTQFTEKAEELTKVVACTSARNLQSAEFNVLNVSAFDDLSKVCSEFYNALEVDAREPDNKKTEGGCFAGCGLWQSQNQQFTGIRNECSEVRLMFDRMKADVAKLNANTICQLQKKALSAKEQTSRFQALPNDLRAHAATLDSSAAASSIHLQPISTEDVDILVSQLQLGEKSVADMVTQTEHASKRLRDFIKSSSSQVHHALPDGCLTKQNKQRTDLRNMLLGHVNKLSLLVVKQGQAINLSSALNKMRACLKDLSEQLPELRANILIANEHVETLNQETKAAAEKGKGPVGSILSKVKEVLHEIKEDIADVTTDVSPANAKPYGDAPEPALVADVIAQPSANGQPSQPGPSTFDSTQNQGSMPHQNSVADSVLETGADPRFDFGPCLIRVTRCTICRRATRNRGDQVTGKIYCQDCYKIRDVQ